MSVAVVWHGIEAFDAGLEREVVAASFAARDAVVEAGALVEARMKEHAGEGGRHAVGTPTPASQGSGPAVITGALRRSIRVSAPIPWGLTGYSIKVGPTIIYGRRIELEYDYPYAEPGLHDATPELPAIFARAWARV